MANQQEEPIISIAEAQNILSQYAQRVFLTLTRHNIEKANIAYPHAQDLIGRVIAKDIYAPINVPDFDNSAMDGYALNTDSVHIAEGEEYSVSIPIIYEASAGAVPKPLEAGACSKIFTGAPIPAGANTIVPIEHCVLNAQDNSIQINTEHAPSEGNHIRALGLNFSKGELVCKKGRAITVGTLTSLASLGITTVQVYKHIDIALCVTGNELQRPDTVLEAGKIYDTNSTLLQQLCNTYGLHITSITHLEDDKEDTMHQLQSLANTHDLVLCTGGVSVGDKDYIQQILLEHGKTHIRKVSIKPGKPFSVISMLNTPFICLPGNPLSVYITFLWFVVPFMQQIQGRVFSTNNNALGMPHTLVPVQSPQEFLPYPRTQFIFSNLDANNHSIEILAEQSSSALKNIMLANGAIIIPQNTKIAKGDAIWLFLF